MIEGTLPSTVRSAIGGMAQDDALMSEVATSKADKASFLRGTAPEHVYDAEARWDEATELDRERRERWRDRMLHRAIVLLSEMASSEGVKACVSSSEPPAWLDCEAASRHLGLTLKAIREGAKSGALPGHKYPAGSTRGRWRFRVEELDAAMSKPARKRAGRRLGLSQW